MHEIKNITITPEILKLIAEIDEFKGRWTVIETLAPEKLTSLRRIATIESVGSSTRIEGARCRSSEAPFRLAERIVCQSRRAGSRRLCRCDGHDLRRV